MELTDLPLGAITPAGWNANTMDDAMRERLRVSIGRFGFLVPLIVRPTGAGTYETVGGAQRLSVLRDLGFSQVACVVVRVDDGESRLLSQCLNLLVGQDDLGLRAELLREVLASLPQEEVLAVLPETAESLQAMASLGQEDMATYLQNWQQAQGARLKHLTLQLTPAQQEVVEQAIACFLPMASLAREEHGSPNTRGTALYLLCRAYLALSREAA